MDNLSYIVFICIMVAFGMMLPLMEKKTRGVVFFMMIGVCCCLFVSEINTIFLNAFHGDMFYVTTTITPITEEIVKTLPILYFAIIWTDDRPTLIANAFAVGVGFALLENMIVLLQSVNDVTILWALIRGFGSGMVHGICTVMVGYGISYIKKRRKLFWSGTFALLSAAITYHAVYNLLVQSRYQNAGILLPAATYIPLILFIRSNALKKKSSKAKPA